MRIYQKRNKWARKGEAGYVLIISGSRQYSGSPVFNGMAALKAGADLITIIGPKRAMDIAATFAPDIITYPLEGDDLKMEHLPEIFELSNSPAQIFGSTQVFAWQKLMVEKQNKFNSTEDQSPKIWAGKFNSLIIGCGLSRTPETYQAIREIIKNVNLPMVIDAEAIRAVAEDKEIIKNKKVVLTPHIEEFRILTGETVKPEKNDRKEKVKKWAAQLGAVILLKGHLDIISDGRRLAINKTGSPYMTKGGFGDTLSGICGALLARGIEPFAAARYAAFINGRAGELAAKRYGESVLASNIFSFIPEIIKRL